LALFLADMIGIAVGLDVQVPFVAEYGEVEMILCICYQKIILALRVDL
jgi:hypothetical protein